MPHAKGFVAFLAAAFTVGCDYQATPAASVASTSKADARLARAEPVIVEDDVPTVVVSARRGDQADAL